MKNEILIKQLKIWKSWSVVSLPLLRNYSLNLFLGIRRLSFFPCWICLAGIFLGLSNADMGCAFESQLKETSCSCMLTRQHFSWIICSPTWAASASTSVKDSPSPQANSSPVNSERASEASTVYQFVLKSVRTVIR